MPTIRENLIQAIAAVKARPEHLFDLDKYIQERECGTLFCTAGLLCHTPHFQGMGWHMEGSYPAVSDTGSFDEQAEIALGEHTYGRLFCQRGGGYWDGELLEPGMTDKDLALARLHRQLEEYA
jgi:hypothetical protein